MLLSDDGEDDGLRIADDIEGLFWGCKEGCKEGTAEKVLAMVGFDDAIHKALVVDVVSIPFKSFIL